jgi:hypothetical protein
MTLGATRGSFICQWNCSAVLFFSMHRMMEDMKAVAQRLGVCKSPSCQPVCVNLVLILLYHSDRLFTILEKKKKYGPQ